MSDVCLRHKDLTDEEEYRYVKESYKENPKLFMNPSEWKKKRLEELRKTGLVWSK